MSRRSTHSGFPSKTRVFPRRLARSMAKARTGLTELRRYDWRRSAADQAQNPTKKGAKRK